jgi:hypothetical protein
MVDAQDELTAAEIPSLKWLLSSQKFEATVIGNDGYPALMVMPDPRAFAVYKLWMSRQLDRDPLKKNRDSMQAMALSAMIREKLPHLSFADESRMIFPASVRGLIGELDGSQSPEQEDSDEDQSFRPR